MICNQTNPFFTDQREGPPCVKYVAEVKGKRIDVLVIDNKSAELYVIGQRWTSALSYDKVLSEKSMLIARSSGRWSNRAMTTP